MATQHVMEPTTFNFIGTIHGKKTDGTELNEKVVQFWLEPDYEPTFASEGDNLTAEHYNQILALLLDIRTRLCRS